MFQLPVTGLLVTAGVATGADHLLLQEAPALDMALALTLIARLAHTADGTDVVWADLPFSDIEALLLLLRKAALGDRISASVVCSASAACSAKIDISFRIGDLLFSQRPRNPKNIERTGTPGWFRLAGEMARFRLPTGADLLAAESGPLPRSELIRRCVEPETPARLRAKLELAMEKMAPRLSQPMTGRCPDCKAEIQFYFDVQSFVLQELRSRAVGVYQEVHLLAFHYKWPEALILELPANRRARYVKLLQEQGVAA